LKEKERREIFVLKTLETPQYLKLLFRSQILNLSKNSWRTDQQPGKTLHCKEFFS